MSSSTTARRLSKSWEDYKPQSAKAKEYDEESGAADHTSIVVKEEEEDPSSSTNAMSLDGSSSSATADESALRGSTTRRRASTATELVSLCEKESKKIKEQERLVNLGTKLFYDGLLELLNEASDVILTIYLWREANKARKNPDDDNPWAERLFIASLFFLCLEVLVRIFTGVVFDLTRTWVPIWQNPLEDNATETQFFEDDEKAATTEVAQAPQDDIKNVTPPCLISVFGCEIQLKRPPLRAFKKDARRQGIFCAFLGMLFEPNLGSVLLERVEDENAKEVPKAPEGVPPAQAEFYELFSDDRAADRPVNGKPSNGCSQKRVAVPFRPWQRRNPALPYAPAGVGVGAASTITTRPSMRLTGGTPKI